jgi:hypothetical protein
MTVLELPRPIGGLNRSVNGGEHVPPFLPERAGGNAAPTRAGGERATVLAQARESTGNPGGTCHRSGGRKVPVNSTGQRNTMADELLEVLHGSETRNVVRGGAKPAVGAMAGG